MFCDLFFLPSNIRSDTHHISNAASLLFPSTQPSLFQQTNKNIQNSNQSKAALLLLGCHYVTVAHAKFINVDASSSATTKLATGATQGLTWIHDSMFQPRFKREPKTMKVVVVGLGRTGTTSFVVALKKLGYTPAHDDDLPQTADVLSGMLDGSISTEVGTQELGQRGFDSAFLTTHSYVEWLATQSDIKVILTLRDTQKWARSFASINRVAFGATQRPFKWIPKVKVLAPYAQEVLLNVPTNGHPELYNDLLTLEAGFESWNEFVRDTIPSERLLELHVKQGWEPLCGFLEKPIPEEAFPHVNDRLVVNTVINTFVVITWIWPVLFALPFFFLYLYFVKRAFQASLFIKKSC